MKTRKIAVGILCVAMALGVSSAAWAQGIGTFRWRTEPYCNVLELTVTQNGPVFVLDGFDQPCGGTPRLPVHGVGVPQADGSLTLGLNVISLSAGTPVNVEAVVSIATVSGTWRDSGGRTGPFSFNPTTTSGGPRPVHGAAGMALAWGTVDGFHSPVTFTGSSNVTGVTKAYNGEYCVSFNSSVPRQRLASAVVTTVYGPNYLHPVVDTHTCPAGTLGVTLLNGVDSGSARDGSFNFIVP